MDKFHIINTFEPNHTPSFIYVSLDTYEGSCVGHWIWECALLLPYIKEVQKGIHTPFKILLHTAKSFKTKILSDYGFTQTDIVYSTNMTRDPYGNSTWQEQCVFPQETEYIMYVPTFFYVWSTSIDSTSFFESLNLFRNYYIEQLSNTTKSIPFSYVTRSKTENYVRNSREFVNKDEFENMLQNNNVQLINTDHLQSLTPQVQDIIQSRTIIVEMGSAFTINAAFFASNSHIIVFNDIFNYHTNDYPFFHIFRKLMNEHNNTVEIFSYGENGASFEVSISEFETLIHKAKLNRTTCIACNNTSFETINSFPQFPIMAISNSSVKEEFFDFTLISCNQCNCLQLKHHVDPSILYSDVYMNAYFSPTWKEHHEMFKNFILANTTSSAFLEIGANRGDLYKLLSNERDINYTTLDMFKHSELPSQIEFIHGNCESFDFTGFTSLILSHVFEHLYSPLTCIANFRKANVKEVFISIPNFDELLIEQSIQVINSQHIFYCGIEYITYMFSLFNYRCNTQLSCGEHLKSNMFHFVLDPTITPMRVPSTDSTLYKQVYVNKIQKIKEIQVPSNCYIAPSGMYGQFFYYFLNHKENIIGFLDNNKQRHQKELYGTGKLVYSPESVDYNHTTVIVCDCPYKDEIIKGLKQINDSIVILDISC